MNTEYLKNVIIPQRELEIKEGRNASTRNPIYIVMQASERIIEGHSHDYDLPSSLGGKKPECGYIDLGLVEAEDVEFCVSDVGMLKPIEITRYWIDFYTAFFLTRKAAEEYLQYQSHNLNNAFIYTFSSGYRNNEMDNLLGNEN